MNAPLFTAIPTYVPTLSARNAASLRTLCNQAQTPCKASGDWTQRPIVVRRGDGYGIVAEPGGYGVVHVTVPKTLSRRDAARHALIALAYELMDGAAREIVRGQLWARPAAKRGRPVSGTRKAVSERQRKFLRQV